MNRKFFIKLLALSPFGFLFGFKRKESEWVKIISKGTLEKYTPYKKFVETVFGYNYEINVVLTKNILIPCVDEITGKNIWETNCYGEYVQMLASCYYGDKNKVDCIYHKFSSQIFIDGKVTDDMYNNFIVQVQNHFEKGICKEYGFHSPFIGNYTEIEVLI